MPIDGLHFTPHSHAVWTVGADTRGCGLRAIDETGGGPAPVSGSRGLETRHMLGLLLLLGGVLLVLPLQTLIGNILPRLRPLGRDLPHPAVAGGIADGQEPVQGLVTEDVGDVAAPAEVEGVGQLFAVLLVEVGGVPFVFALGFEGGVALAEVGVGGRGGGGGRGGFAFFRAEDAGEGVGVDFFEVFGEGLLFGGWGGGVAVVSFADVVSVGVELVLHVSS